MSKQKNQPLTTALLPRRRVLAAMGVALSATILSGCMKGEAAPEVTKTAAGAEPSPTLTSPEPPPTTESPEAVVSQAPFAPQNIDLFLPQIYLDATETRYARFKQFNPDEVRATLEATLQRRFEQDALQERRVREALALFDDSALNEVVPDIRLRAAIVNLTGTVGEPVIETFLTGIYDSVRFGYLRGGPLLIAQVTGDGRPFEMTFNSTVKYEDFRLFTPYMAHEALHQDTTVNEKEEVIIDSIDVLVYAQQLLTNRELALGDTTYTRYLNTNLLARLNSRDEQGHMAIRGGKNEIFPNADLSYLKGFGQYRDLARGDEENITDWISQESLPGNPTLDSVVSASTGRQASGLLYDEATIDLLDEQVVLSPADQLRLYEILSAFTEAASTGESTSTPTPEA